MISTSRSLPKFIRPPLVEVALSVQFEPLQGLRAPQIGLLWNLFRQDYPDTDEKPPLPATIETFGPIGETSGELQIQLIPVPPLPRYWFTRAQGRDLIQIQQDRFAYNWRKDSADAPYPSYSYVMEDFKKNFGVFRSFIEKEAGTMLPNQCEVTYVNHIFLGDGWDRFDQIGNVITLLSSHYSEPFLPDIEQIRLAANTLSQVRTAGLSAVYTLPRTLATTGRNANLY